MRVWMRCRAFQRAADRADAAVHHVARRDDVDAGLGLHQRLADQHLHGLVVEDVAGVVEQAVLAVAGVRVERHVGHQPELRKARLQRAHRARHQALGVAAPRGRRASSAPDRSPGTAPSPACPASGIPRPCATGDRPSGAARRACRRRLGCGARRRARTPDRSGRWVEAVLAHQRAREGVAAQAPGPAGGKRRGRWHSEAFLKVRDKLCHRPSSIRCYAESHRVIPLLGSSANDSCKAVVPCFSSLSRCLTVMTAIRLATPIHSIGVFFGDRRAECSMSRARPPR